MWPVATALFWTEKCRLNQDEPSTVRKQCTPTQALSYGRADAVGLYWLQAEEAKGEIQIKICLQIIAVLSDLNHSVMARVQSAKTVSGQAEVIFVLYLI